MRVIIQVVDRFHSSSCGIAFVKVFLFSSVLGLHANLIQAKNRQEELYK